MLQDGSHHLKFWAAEWQKEERTKLACREVPRNCHRTFPVSPCFPEPSYTGTPSCKRFCVATWGFWKGRLDLGEQLCLCKRPQCSFEDPFPIRPLPKLNNNRHVCKSDYEQGTALSALHMNTRHPDNSPVRQVPVLSPCYRWGS